MTGQSTRDPAAERLILEPSPASPVRALRLVHQRAVAWSLPEAVRDRVRISVQDRSSAPVAPRRRQFRSQHDRHRDTVAAARGRLP